MVWIWATNRFGQGKITKIKKGWYAYVSKIEISKAADADKKVNLK